MTSYQCLRGRGIMGGVLLMVILRVLLTRIFLGAADEAVASQKNGKKISPTNH